MIPFEQFSLGEEAAIARAGTNWWEKEDARLVASYQLRCRELCMPFGKFQEAVEKALERGVWTHEFAYPQHLWAELHKDAPAPSMEDIINMIPAEKRIVIAV